MEQKTIGVLSILAASIMWAVEPILAKLSYSNSNFLQTSAIRSFVIVFIAAAYATATNRGNFKVNKTQLYALFYIAAAATLIAELVYFYAIAKIPVVNAVLIGHFQPVFIVLFGYLILKEEKLSGFDYLGIFFMIAAGLLVSTRTLGNLMMLRIGTLADFLVLASAVLWATTAIATRKYLKGLNSGVISFYRYLIASAAFAAYLALTSSIKISNIYQILVGIAVGIGSILYYEGLKRLKASQVGALELSAPLFAAIFSFFILGEKITLMQAFGIALLFFGVYFLSKKEG